MPRRQLQTVRFRVDATNNTAEEAIPNTAEQCRVVASDATTDATTRDAAVGGVSVDVDAEWSPL
ncbi:MAG: hypothetical protein GY767_17325 [Shimia sp.]|nr:hypothetical protein [Shimia sp.]